MLQGFEQTIMLACSIRNSKNKKNFEERPLDSWTTVTTTVTIYQDYMATIASSQAENLAPPQRVRQRRPSCEGFVKQSQI